MELIRRSAWGAAPPTGKPVAIPVPVRDLFLHHSAGPDGGPETVRAIQKFHQQSRGWADIAYSWLYSPRDRVFYEGRGPGVQQAAQRSHNSTGHSVCVLGNYEAARPPAHVVRDLADWGEWHGGTWGPSIYRPHRDVNATICPGKHLVDLLPQINGLNTGTTVPPSELPPTLRKGDKGDDVKFLQAAIMAHDGIFGDVTEAAVRAYQQANGLKVDGICGPNTWSSILQA